MAAMKRCNSAIRPALIYPESAISSQTPTVSLMCRQLRRFARRWKQRSTTDGTSGRLFTPDAWKQSQPPQLQGKQRGRTKVQGPMLSSRRDLRDERHQTSPARRSANINSLPGRMSHHFHGLLFCDSILSGNAGNGGRLI
jgi:hypothetical protein